MPGIRTPQQLSHSLYLSSWFQVASWIELDHNLSLSAWSLQHVPFLSGIAVATWIGINRKPKNTALKWLTITVQSKNAQVWNKVALDEIARHRISLAWRTKPGMPSSCRLNCTSWNSISSSVDSFLYSIGSCNSHFCRSLYFLCQWLNLNKPRDVVNEKLERRPRIRRRNFWPWYFPNGFRLFCLSGLAMEGSVTWMTHYWSQYPLNDFPPFV